MTRPRFTILVSFLLMAAPAVARADRIVLLPPTGAGEELRHDDIDEAMRRALSELGHEVTSESGVPTGAPPPESGNELRAVAEMQGAQWVIVPRITSAQASRYRLNVRVGWAQEGRVEELEVTVLEAGEDARLRDVLGAMLRVEGVGDDALRLTEEPTAPAGPTPEEEEAERRRLEEERAREERARREYEERERQRAEEERRRAERAWEDRERYGQHGDWLLSIGLDVRPIVATAGCEPPAGSMVTPACAGGSGLLWGGSLRIGRSFEGAPGLEARAVVDVMGGSAGAFDLGVGAVYLHSFFEAPVFIGIGVELGWFQALTGNNSASFFLRGAPTIAWRATGGFHVEAALGEVMWSSSTSTVTIGASVRVGYRF